MHSEMVSGLGLKLSMRLIPLQVITLTALPNLIITWTSLQTSFVRKKLVLASLPLSGENCYLEYIVFLFTLCPNLNLRNCAWLWTTVQAPPL